MKILSPLIILLAATMAHAQYPQKVFFSKNGKKCDEKDAYVFQITQGPVNLLAPGIPSDNKDTTVTVYFAGNNKACMIYTCLDGHRDGPYKLYYENGSLKEEGFEQKGRQHGKVSRYYPNGKLHEVLEFRGDVIGPVSTNDVLILDYRDSLGVQTVKEGSGICRRYFFVDNDSSSAEREDGLLKDGLREQEWAGYKNDTLYYKDIFSHGKFVKGVRYDEGNEISYNQIERQPEYPGGLEGLSRFLSKTLKYPKDARWTGVDGRVFVQFVVLRDGRVSDVEVIKGVSHSLDEEAIRVVKLMPNWEPGMQRGKAAKARFVLPIRFKLGR